MSEPPALAGGQFVEIKQMARIVLRELKKYYVEQKMSLTDVAAKFGVRTYDVVSYLAKKKIPMRIASEIPTEELRRLYIDQNFSSALIGQQYGFTENTICLEIKKRGIPQRPSSSDLAKAFRESIDIPELIRQYSEKHISVRELADHHTVSVDVIYTILRRNNAAIGKKSKTEAHLAPLKVLEIDQTIVINLPNMIFEAMLIHTAARKLNIKVQVRQILNDTYSVKRIS